MKNLFNTNKIEEFATSHCYSYYNDAGNDYSFNGCGDGTGYGEGHSDGEGRCCDNRNFGVGDGYSWGIGNCCG